MQIGIVAKKIGLSVDAIRFYERNGLLPRPPRTQGGLPEIRRKRRGDTCFCPPRTGPGIQAQRDPRSLEPARKSLAALCVADWKKSWSMCNGNLPTFRS